MRPTLFALIVSSVVGSAINECQRYSSTFWEKSKNRPFFDVEEVQESLDTSSANETIPTVMPDYDLDFGTTISDEKYWNEGDKNEATTTMESMTAPIPEPLKKQTKVTTSNFRLFMVIMWPKIKPTKKNMMRGTKKNLIRCKKQNGKEPFQMFTADILNSIIDKFILEYKGSIKAGKKNFEDKNVTVVLQTGRGVWATGFSVWKNFNSVLDLPRADDLTTHLLKHEHCLKSKKSGMLQANHLTKVVQKLQQLNADLPDNHDFHFFRPQENVRMLKQYSGKSESNKMRLTKSTENFNEIMANIRKRKIHITGCYKKQAKDTLRSMQGFSVRRMDFSKPEDQFKFPYEKKRV